MALFNSREPEEGQGAVANLLVDSVPRHSASTGCSPRWPSRRSLWGCYSGCPACSPWFWMGLGSARSRRVRRATGLMWRRCLWCGVYLWVR